MSINSGKKLSKIVRPEHGKTPEKEKAIEDERERIPPAHREVKQLTVSFEMIKRLMVAYPQSTINESGEFCTQFDNYFSLDSCADSSEVECKVLEWFSRPAYRGGTSKSRSYMRGGLETFFDREFSDREIERIYTHLGNSISRERTKRYIASGFDISVLSEDD